MNGQSERKAWSDPCRVEIAVPARPEHVAMVRRALERLDLPVAVLEDAKLLATELVTNSIRHARLSPEEEIRVTAEWSGARLRVTVRDRSDPGALPGVAGSIRPPPGAESGWGLYLLDRIAARWGTRAEGGAAYWFELE